MSPHIFQPFSHGIFEILKTKNAEFRNKGIFQSPMHFIDYGELCEGGIVLKINKKTI